MRSGNASPENAPSGHRAPDSATRVTDRLESIASGSLTRRSHNGSVVWERLDRLRFIQVMKLDFSGEERLIRFCATNRPDDRAVRLVANRTLSAVRIRDCPLPRSICFFLRSVAPL